MTIFSCTFYVCSHEQTLKALIENKRQKRDTIEIQWLRYGIHQMKKVYNKNLQKFDSNNANDDNDDVSIQT